MRTTAKAVRRWMFGAGMGAALGFGALQATAAPAAAADAKVCSERLCDRICQSLGSIGGVCNPDGFCVCFL